LETQIDQAAIENLKTQIASLKLNQGKIFRNLELLSQEKSDKVFVINEMNQVNQTLHRHSKDIEYQHNQCLTIENFMEKYIPIKVQTQISETLKAVLDKKSLKYLDLFETQKFEHLHSAILDDDGNPAIADQVKKLSEAIESLSSSTKKLSTSRTLQS
jgi:hypothetical protein